MARHSIVATLASTYMRIQDVIGVSECIRRFLDCTPRTYEMAKKEAVKLYGEHGLLAILVMVTMDLEECSLIQRIMGGRFAIQIVKYTEVAAKILPIKHRVKVTGFTKEVMDELERELEDLIAQNRREQMNAYDANGNQDHRAIDFDSDGNITVVTHYPIFGEPWAEHL